MQIPFTKMHGLGNDFMVIDTLVRDVKFTPQQIQHFADRRFGIGFDQLLLIKPPSSPDVDFDYQIFNGDGEEVEHCGNGARCFATYVQDKQLSENNPLKVKTVNRILSLMRQEDGQVSVNMGEPVFTPGDIPLLGSDEATTYERSITVADKPMSVQFSALSVGNPHAVITVDDVENTAVTEIGEALGKHPDFPEGVNVGFMQIQSRERISLRVFERGVGETLACGTGACAAVVAGCLQGLLDGTVNVNLRGGELVVSWQPGEPIIMTGPTTKVYEGTIEI